MSFLLYTGHIVRTVAVTVIRKLGGIFIPFTDGEAEQETLSQEPGLDSDVWCQVFIWSEMPRDVASCFAANVP